ncbi:MAG: M36 family metallopeptidase, partial [Blastocatellia bacterium]|nr:M36 family metallopeptidase [Blastocatellia bacterium]
MPSQFRSEAGVSNGEGLSDRTGSHESSLPNYDIREQKGRDSVDFRLAARQASGKDASAVANTRDSFVQGEGDLRRRVPGLKVEYNRELRNPEVIGSDVAMGRNFLSGPSSNRVTALRGFVKENGDLVGVNDSQADSLKVLTDYTNPDGKLSFTHLEQRINDVPVFRGELKAGFTKSGEIVRVINNLAPGLDYESLSTDFRNPADAVRSAARHIGYDLKSTDATMNAAGSTDLKVVFGSGDWATTAEKIYFPTEPGVARAAWRVLIWQPVNAYYVIVDAETGTMLWRKNIGEDQTQAATYQVYANPLAMINSADNPAPMTPGPIDPTTGTQGAISSRVNVTRVGNEAPFTFNNLGWITDGTNITDGNAVEAGIDRVAPNGVDAAQVGNPNRVFDAPTWNPPPGNPTPGDAPLTTQAQRGAVIQMFYVMNMYHDELYRLGFTESAFNFQNDNFGRGGVGADRVSAEGQDSSGTNNANFNTPVDGGRGRMQMYIWTGPTPDYDGTVDAEIIIHEVTHGTSNRLHGNASGLTTNMARGMGEGWSDFYAHAMLSEPSDPINGIYTVGGYATHLGAAGFNSNYYHGIRRFPKAVMAFTGGPSNRPHNPLTFADLNAGCVLTDGAFPRGPFGASQCDAVHNAGEIWSSALWEVRARYIQRLAWADGNRRILQHVTDGMKLAPIGPTFLQERDAIIAGALATGTAADVADLWAGFAIRGMGFSSRVTAAGSPAVVVEAFDLPNLLQTPTFAVSDASGDNDGFPEPGETLSLTIPLTNNTGNVATGVTLQVVGGGTANYGTINNGQTVAQQVSYTVPGGAACGSSHTLTFNVNSNLGATTIVRTIILGAPNVTFTENFDGVTAPAFPAGWTAAPEAGGINFVTSTTTPDTAPNAAFALDPLTVGGATSITSPSIPITAQAATVTFRNNYNTEAGWDGGVLEISIGAGAFADIITAGGSFVQNGYNGSLGAGANNPIANRAAWNGNSGGYVTTIATLPAAAAGQSVRLRWRFGADDNTAAVGWFVDTISVVGNYTCSVATVRSRADFDGDGRTDLSIFRPSDGNWYLNRSTDGSSVVSWGLSADIQTPGDFDGDNKADTAIFRPSTGTWWILRSSGGVSSTAFGASGDVPVVGDYNGDGTSDIALFRPSNNTWYIQHTGGGTLTAAFGAAGDLPVRGDYNGDGSTDIAIYRPNTGAWWIANSGGGVTATTFGIATDKPVPADYDGDNKDDIAVFRPSTGTWYILRSTSAAVD